MVLVYGVNFTISEHLIDESDNNFPLASMHIKGMDTTMRGATILKMWEHQILHSTSSKQCIWRNCTRTKIHYVKNMTTNTWELSLYNNNNKITDKATQSDTQKLDCWCCEVMSTFVSSHTVYYMNVWFNSFEWKRGRIQFVLWQDK